MAPLGDMSVDRPDAERLSRIKQRMVNLLADGDVEGPAAVVMAEILRDELAGY